MGDNFLKVVALPSLRTEAPRMLSGSALELPSSGTIMAKLFQLNFLRANEFVPQLAQLLNPQLGGPILFEKTNAVMITDSVSTLQRIEMLIAELDKPVTANLTPKFYQLQFAKASVLVNQLRTILQGAVQSQLGSATSYSRTTARIRSSCSRIRGSMSFSTPSSPNWTSRPIRIRAMK
jgi:general secretion pathway protein D